MDNVDKELVRKIADMAMLNVTEDEVEEFVQYFKEMFEVFDVLSNVPVDYEFHVEGEGTFHDDEPSTRIDYHDLWMRFSLMKNGYLLVPPIRGDKRDDN